MKTFFAFLKKELFESARGGKLMILLAIFTLFGIMNPAIAKLTPWMLEMMADELEGSGMTITEVEVNAITSWVQFFKNIPMALIAFVCIYGGIFTKEYTSGTLILILTKGLARYKVVLAKALHMLILWSAGYFLCFGITYAYNAYFWDNSIVDGLMPAVMNWYLFGVFTVCLTFFFSVISKSTSGVLLGTGGVVLLSYLLEMLPKVKEYCPTRLMNTAHIAGGDMPSLNRAIAVTAALSLICITASIPIFNKKQL